MDVRECYIEKFPHTKPHEGKATLLSCGHWACVGHTITYFGTGENDEAPEGSYCLVCYNRILPGLCSDKVLLEALLQV